MGFDFEMHPLHIMPLGLGIMPLGHAKSVFLNIFSGDLHFLVVTYLSIGHSDSWRRCNIEGVC